MLHGCAQIRPSDDMKLRPPTGSICVVQNADDLRVEDRHRAKHELVLCVVLRLTLPYLLVPRS